MIRSVGRLLVCLLATTSVCQARSVSVRVQTADGAALAEAVVYARSPAPYAPPGRAAIMDQVHKNFFPYILPVQAGTWVDFPNSDSNNHHVYSFSPAKRFELQLDRNDHSPHRVLFDTPGLVTLGCNIHDWMLGYVLVLDTPWFAQTDASGEARLELPDEGEWRVSIWHPRIADAAESLERPLPGAQLLIELREPLKPDLREQQGSYE